MKNPVVENLLQAFFKANPSHDGDRGKKEYAKNFFKKYGDLTVKQLQAQLLVTTTSEMEILSDVRELSDQLITFLIAEKQKVVED